MDTYTYRHWRGKPSIYESVRGEFIEPLFFTDSGDSFSGFSHDKGAGIHQHLFLMNKAASPFLVLYWPPSWFSAVGPNNSHY